MGGNDGRETVGNEWDNLRRLELFQLLHNKKGFVYVRGWREANTRMIRISVEETSSGVAVGSTVCSHDFYTLEVFFRRKMSKWGNRVEHLS